MTRIGLYASAFALCSTMAGATVVNFDAMTNAHPSDFLNNFVSLDLTAGDYEVTAIEDLYTALNVWNNVRGCDGNGENCANGWFGKYSVMASNGDTLLDYSGFSEGEIFSTAAAALVSTQADGPQAFSLSADDTVYIGLFDNPVSDNAGGMSLNIENVTAVPLPAGAPLLLAGIGLLMTRRAVKGTGQTA